MADETTTPKPEDQQQWPNKGRLNYFDGETVLDVGGSFEDAISFGYRERDKLEDEYGLRLADLSRGLKDGFADEDDDGDADDESDSDDASGGGVSGDAYDIKNHSVVTKEQFITLIGKVQNGKNIKEYAEQIYESSQKWNINPLWSLSQSAYETGWWTSTAFKKHNNVGGLSWREDGYKKSGTQGYQKSQAVYDSRWQYFKSPGDSFNAKMWLLRKVYIDSWGRDTTEKIIPKYAPAFENNVPGYIKIVNDNIDKFCDLLGIDPDENTGSPSVGSGKNVAPAEAQKFYNELYGLMQDGKISVNDKARKKDIKNGNASLPLVQLLLYITQVKKVKMQIGCLNSGHRKISAGGGVGRHKYCNAFDASRINGHHIETTKGLREFKKVVDALAEITNNGTGKNGWEFFGPHSLADYYKTKSKKKIPTMCKWISGHTNHIHVGLPKKYFPKNYMNSMWDNGSYEPETDGTKFYASLIWDTFEEYEIAIGRKQPRPSQSTINSRLHDPDAR